MKIVIPAAKYIDALLGKPAISNSNYKFSQFNCSVNYEDKILIHNTFTKECIMLDADEYSKFTTIDRENDCFSFFVEHRYYIDENINEIELLNQAQNT